ncbi:hypothetical protein LJ655_22600 [Paraburkholderia sp. MMS20-SJTN17]|uniref:Uncharacterized protein n=1 Tax=Paraburkholderia translucens TaxID=2886945 RepID=A0ABS8KIW2_9BURK|nr:hypothetical protein [Paraburkholderia sp. MMS20-SJTN17]MCC8404635.1 hypothetical protein [Paraburkholderia sp. MMS20-SJTN17]
MAHHAKEPAGSGDLVATVVAIGPHASHSFAQNVRCGNPSTLPVARTDLSRATICVGFRQLAAAAEKLSCLIPGYKHAKDSGK